MARVIGGRGAAAIGAVALAAIAGIGAQQPALDRLAGLPGADAYASMQERLRTAQPLVTGALQVTWSLDSGSFTYLRDGHARRFDVRALAETDIDSVPMPPARPSPPHTSSVDPCPPAVLERGRQSACAGSPDGTMKAFTRDRNLYISRADGSGEIAVTRDGSATTRLKYGVASWVYGEELDQTTAIWWAPDGGKVAFYRFDERPVADYFLARDQTSIQDTLDVEAYPKTGTANPIADILVYDLASRHVQLLDVRDGRPFTDEVVGHYVFGAEWSPDSTELRVHRTDRRQQTLELAACRATTGACRVIVRERSTTGWIENRPTRVDLDDGRRFIWQSDRTGWRNYYLYDFSGQLIRPLTSLDADASAIVKVDEEAGLLFYMAKDGDNFLKQQLHVVGLDGRGERRLTDPAFTHAVRISPDSTRFVDVYETHDIPPSTRLVTIATGATHDLAHSDLGRFRALGLRTVEHFSYLAADGRTTLYGSIAFPSTFDPAMTYPTLVSVYGGPESASETPTETFTIPNGLTEYGFLRVRLTSRAVPGLGRRALDALYGRLGQTELDDLAAGVRALLSRPYVDGTRIGIFGTSYGGYLAALALVRYPDLFAAASASSPVTDWRDYDTIYTERYMGLPADNPEGYDKGRVMRYADRLRGRLLLYYGTADNNVHPSNTLQLIQALNRAHKSYEVQVGPDAAHGAVNMERMMEFFVDNLVLRPERLRTIQP
jgi:dipeptidyl-peptidase-4